MRSLILCISLCLSLLVTLSKTQTSPDIIPSSSVNPMFNCWFPTYTGSQDTDVSGNGSMMINIVFGYQNTGSQDVFISVGINNAIMPLIYNGNQPFVFKSSGGGENPYVVVVKDSNGILSSQGE